MRSVAVCHAILNQNCSSRRSFRQTRLLSSATVASLGFAFGAPSPLLSKFSQTFLDANLCVPFNARSQVRFLPVHPDSSLMLRHRTVHQHSCVGYTLLQVDIQVLMTVVRLNCPFDDIYKLFDIILCSFAESLQRTYQETTTLEPSLQA